MERGHCIKPGDRTPVNSSVQSRMRSGIPQGKAIAMQGLPGPVRRVK